MCETGKRQYGSAAEARSAFFRMRRGMKPNRPYRCPFCKMWHLTSHKTKGSGRKAKV